MSTSNDSSISRFRKWIKQSLYIKIASIGFIIILLMIPNGLIKNLINERNYNHTSAINEVSQKWGGDQQLVGPVLTIPYITYLKDKDGKVTESTKYAHFLPEQLNIDGDINSENRKRGIYDVVLYQTGLDFQGWFAKPDFEKFGIPEKDVKFDNAFLQVSIPDMTGISESIQMKFDNEVYRMEPGILKINGFNSGVRITLAIDPEKKKHVFSFDLNLNGSKALTFGPIGKETNVHLRSNWESPSFMGSFLPDDHSISESGFEASWKILDLNRNYPQSWTLGSQNLTQSLFGLELIQPVDEYAKNYRSAKYALLVIILTFLIFFFFEVINKQKVHPMHYILVGSAISVFYILLLSLSEHIGFNMAYLISSIAIVGMISLYSTTILDSRFLSLLLSGILSAIIGFIFIILQLEDFALLAGAIGLFLTLAVVMYYSRNVDWSNVGRGEQFVVQEIV